MNEQEMHDFYKDHRESAKPFLKEAWSKGQKTQQDDVKTLSHKQVASLIEKHREKIYGNPSHRDVDNGMFGRGEPYGYGGDHSLTPISYGSKTYVVMKWDNSQHEEQGMPIEYEEQFTEPFDHSKEDHPIHVSKAKYAKDKAAVRIKSDESGFKGRAHRLADYHKGNYSHRENAYIMPYSKAKKLLEHYDQGYDSNLFGDKLEPPSQHSEDQMDTQFAEPQHMGSGWYFHGHGMDRNGNHRVKVSQGANRAFSVQTNQEGLHKLHSYLTNDRKAPLTDEMKRTLIQHLFKWHRRTTDPKRDRKDVEMPEEKQFSEENHVSILKKHEYAPCSLSTRKNSSTDGVYQSKTGETVSIAPDGTWKHKGKGGMVITGKGAKELNEKLHIYHRTSQHSEERFTEQELKDYCSPLTGLIGNQAIGATTISQPAVQYREEKKQDYQYTEQSNPVFQTYANKIQQFGERTHGRFFAPATGQEHTSDEFKQHVLSHGGEVGPMLKHGVFSFSIPPNKVKDFHKHVNKVSNGGFGLNRHYSMDKE